MSQLVICQHLSDFPSFKKGEPPLHPDLASVRKRFSEEAGIVLTHSKMDVHEQIRAKLDSVIDPNDLPSRVEEAHTLFREGLNLCLESLVSIVRDCFGKLVKITESHPEWLITDKPRWARRRMQELLDEKLYPGGRIRHGSPKPSPLPVVDRFFRWACDGPPLGPLETGGYVEPWCVLTLACQYNKPGAWPDRLTVEQTERMLKGDRFRFDERLKNVLEKAEDEARIELACQPQASRWLESSMRLHQADDTTGSPAASRSKTGADAANLTEKPTPKEKIMFIERDGKTVPSVPIRKISKEAWLNSYEELSQNLDELRILVHSNGNKASAKQLRKPFRGTYLGSVATSDEERDELIATLRAGTTAINATLVLLETKTRVKRESITVYCSEARTTGGILTPNPSWASVRSQSERFVSLEAAHAPLGAEN